MEEILFTKMHGLGNDYIYINCLHSLPKNLETLAIEMSCRHTGIGGDGIILICPSQVADFKMRIFNADGSEAKMCGNGSRCVAKYVFDYGLTDSTTISLETLGGIKHIELQLDSDGTVIGATVDMGPADFSARAVPVISTRPRLVNESVEVDGQKLSLTAVSMGNPHGVVFIEGAVDEYPVHSIGRQLECHPMFPERANIEFVEVKSDTQLKMRVWERGSGETMACGTGACAVAASAMELGITGTEVEVELPGGCLHISKRKSDGHILMRGPAATVFEGRYFRNKK